MFTWLKWHFKWLPIMTIWMFKWHFIWLSICVPFHIKVVLSSNIIIMLVSCSYLVVYTSPFCWWGEGGLNLLHIFKKWKLDRISIFRGSCWKEEVTFFRWRGGGEGGWCSFYIKNKLKSGICTEESIFFSVIIKNSNWEILA